MNKKVTSIVSYCTILGWLVAYFAGDRENSKFHLCFCCHTIGGFVV